MPAMYRFLVPVTSRTLPVLETTKIVTRLEGPGLVCCFAEQARHRRVEALEPLGELPSRFFVLVAVDDEVIAAGLQPFGMCR